MERVFTTVADINHMLDLIKHMPMGELRTFIFQQKKKIGNSFKLIKALHEVDISADNLKSLVIEIFHVEKGRQDQLENLYINPIKHESDISEWQLLRGAILSKLKDEISDEDFDEVMMDTMRSFEFMKQRNIMEQV